ncbi:hypothetical protein ATV_gp28 [Bicaudavirus pozzuoliense]|uniref:Putative zinc finger protein ORF189 n=2 Tax=Acidianus two-tailed virus TaxID=315953 RepID=Y189_ATV|nr:hypothetical protein ATV_gp28 [Acidianus two-tailed virus]Q3V4V8.1 RecName: Full=Putative zinc finger protein ORF189 [Acidianus two-tailed virus]AON96506.1 hypothetical protein [Acidianus two-tailed phage variant 1]CAI59856.1 hypothetical protein [Acidianus two-tailed virus]
MKVLSFLIRQDHLLYLDIFAKQNNLTRSDAIRYAISVLDEESTPVSLVGFPGIKLVRTSVKLAENVISRIDRLAILSKITRSDVIRNAIYHLLINNAPKQLPPVTAQTEKKYGYVCPYCVSRFPTVRALKIHLKRRHNGFPWCPVCYKPLKNKNATNHFRRFTDPQHQFWYMISRKRYLSSHRKEAVKQ